MQEAKPVLAVDVDEVLFSFVPTYLDRHNERNGTRFTEEDMPGYDIIYFLHNLGDDEDQEPYVTEFLQWVDQQGIPPHPEVVRALTKLKAKYSIVAITFRPTDVLGATENWLTQHFPNIFNDVHFMGMRQEGTTKLEICQEIGAEVLIEDRPKNIADCAKFETQCLLFGQYRWTHEIELPASVKRVKDWNEVLEALL